MLLPQGWVDLPHTLKLSLEATLIHPCSSFQPPSKGTLTGPLSGVRAHR